MADRIPELLRRMEPDRPLADRVLDPVRDGLHRDLEHVEMTMPGGSMCESRFNAIEEAAEGFRRGFDGPARRLMNSLEDGYSGRGINQTISNREVRNIEEAHNCAPYRVPPICTQERTPMVAAPSRMSEERNAQLFPSGPSNDELRRAETTFQAKTDSHAWAADVSRAAGIPAHQQTTPLRAAREALEALRIAAGHEHDDRGR